MRYCFTCGRALALHARSDARYCSTACRMVAYRRRQHGGKVSPALLETARGWESLVRNR